MEQRLSRTKMIGFFDTLGELIVCNVLWVACSLPVFTIGASTAALFTCMRGVLERKAATPKLFFAEFRRCFKPATGAWLLLLALFALVAANVYLLPALEARMRSVLMAFLGVLTLVLLLWGAHIFPLISKNQSAGHSGAGLMKLTTTAFALGIRYLPLTISAVFVQVLPIVLFIAFPNLFLYALAVYGAFGIALSSLYHAFIIERIWVKSHLSTGS